MSTAQNVSLISRWFVTLDTFGEAMSALKQLAEDVWAQEPDTLTYFVHTHFGDDPRLQALPPADDLSILFFESYRNPDAFLAHVNGPVFTNFVAKHGALFVAKDGSPYTTVEFLELHAGFARNGAPAAPAAAPAAAVNPSPAVMFEIIANDQPSISRFYADVFGWTFQSGTGGFDFIHFPGTDPALLGGIGQTNPEPGFEPGHNFYLRVDDLDETIARAIAAGGSLLMPPTQIDGYSFAMIRDPENNPVGLILPFTR
jgi:predicted enzyme related to lactoylglutathione lyase/quinol monooxygenase YgiN